MSGVTKHGIDPSHANWLQDKVVLLAERAEPSPSQLQSWLSEAGARIATAHGPRQALEVLLTWPCRFDLLIIDAPMLNGDCFALGEQLKLLYPACALLFIAQDPSLQELNAVHSMGGGYISKHATRWELLLRAHWLVERELPNPALLATRAERRWRLTPQERRVLFYNLWSCSNHEIASFLGVSLNTVHEYQTKLRKKTGARTKDGYVRRLLELYGKEPPPLDFTATAVWKQRRNVPNLYPLSSEQHITP